MLIAWAAVAAGAASQTVAGFGFALVSAPFLIATVGPHTGVRMVITLSCLISLMLLVRTWRRARARDAVLLALPGVVLAVPLALLVRHLDQDVLTVTAGSSPSPAPPPSPARPGRTSCVVSAAS
ncbi:hypothetical protein NKH77_31865 [Streptomyces sp. M19]